MEETIVLGILASISVIVLFVLIFKIAWSPIEKIKEYLAFLPIVPYCIISIVLFFTFNNDHNIFAQPKVVLTSKNV